ncbi:hypothetical protein [Streptomyces cinnamoneus]|uniref:hypothetical protein n=1 Tax=Streptomyces cinnamoneus TaxID=53446 RepID=UPI00167DF10B|nr:hypothetical protein [Streptomyces cinnamoneus]
MTDPKSVPPFYVLLSTGVDAASRMASTLAEIFTLPPQEVELYEDSLLDEVNWEAKALCEYAPRSGDLDYSLYVTVSDEVEYQPLEEDLAVRLARSHAGQALTELDATYHSHTVEDGGRALVQAAERAPAVGDHSPWYWNGRPVRLPWGHEGAPHREC